jgi:uncharacterized protein with GYD domain
LYIQKEIGMAKYLFQASYVGEGRKGLLREGGTARRDNLEKTVAAVGGTIESFYYAFGPADVVVIADLPDNITAAGLALTIAGSGMIEISTTVLLTPAEIDQAVKAGVSYRAPGQ